MGKIPANSKNKSLAFQFSAHDWRSDNNLQIGQDRRDWLKTTEGESEPENNSGNSFIIEDSVLSHL